MVAFFGFLDLQDPLEKIDISKFFIGHWVINGLRGVINRKLVSWFDSIPRHLDIGDVVFAE